MFKLTNKPYDGPLMKRSCYKMNKPALQKKCDCWKGYKRVPGTKPCAKGSCKKAQYGI